MFAQTWLGGNTISDLLIASAMLYHVNSSFFLYIKEPFKADLPTPIRQLIKKARGNFNTHVHVSIVRLTVETNVVTSKPLQSLRCHGDPPQSHARSATVSIIGFLMAALYPVSGSMDDRHKSAVIDASTLPYRTTIGSCARTYSISFCRNLSSHIIIII